MVTHPDLAAVREYLLQLQDRICAALEAEDPGIRFREDRDERPGGALSRARVLEEGSVLEKAAVHFTHAVGDRLPPAATERKPQLAGAGFQAASLSLIVHPRNPYAPTTHANFRCFCTEPRSKSEAAAWWFGGGFDLTPYYGFEEDAIHWHRMAREACQPLGDSAYPRFKQACDEYFFLPHRSEARGIGGLFYDDLEEGGFDRCFGFTRSVGDHFLPAYVPLLARRKDTPYGERERDFQLYRRGRYVEFNLVYDRGTRYGMQSGRRIESVLASLPPAVHWRYDWRPEPGSPEARLTEYFLKPRDWLALSRG
ncbi:MAG: oxygen-dependent coproporphyrinogen oxidase [Myxococcota bacterium]